MPYLILIALFSIPYFEFLVFVMVSDEIGGWSAFLLTLITAIVGIYLIKLQGIGVIGKLQENLQNGKSPVKEIMHGLLLLVAGFFFLLPGFMTDGTALLLSIPFVRDVIAHLFAKSIPVDFNAGATNSDQPSPYKDGMTIDGDYEEGQSDDEKGQSDDEKGQSDDEKGEKISDSQKTSLPPLEKSDKDPKS